MKLLNFIKNNLYLIIGVLLFVLFVVWTLLVKFVDVSNIGPLDSSVGLATFNKTFFDLITPNETLIKITSILMILPIALAGVVVVIAIIEWVKRKHILKVDHEILLFGLFLVILVCLFVLFEVVVINYRPILEDGELAASYPSTHALICTFIYLSLLPISNKLFKNNKIIKLVINISLVLLFVISVVGRLLSGAHWMSDIIGGLLLATSLFFFYFNSINIVNRNLVIKK